MSLSRSWRGHIPTQTEYWSFGPASCSFLPESKMSAASLSSRASIVTPGERNQWAVRFVHAAHQLSTGFFAHRRRLFVYVQSSFTRL